MVSSVALQLVAPARDAVTGEQRHCDTANKTTNDRRSSDHAEQLPPTQFDHGFLVKLLWSHMAPIAPMAPPALIQGHAAQASRTMAPTTAISPAAMSDGVSAAAK
jgi:hypothetical protein